MYFYKSVKEFKKYQMTIVAASVCKVFDENIPSWGSQTKNKGVFIHISFIDEKPKPLGTELNNLECSDTDIILLLEIKRVKKFIFHLENTDFNPKNACSIDIF